MRLFIMLAALLLATSAQASVVFEDNFDGHADWHPAQVGSDSEHCSTGDCSIPTGYNGWRMNGSSVPGGKGSMNIDGINHRGTAGKGLTFYPESVGDWTNDYLLDLKLANGSAGFNEIYVRYWVKFQPGWQWAQDGMVGEKFLHVAHYDPALGNNRYDFFSPTQNKPRDVFLLYKYGGGAGDICSDSMISILQNPATSNSQSREMLKYFPPNGNYNGSGTDFADTSWSYSPWSGGMMGDGQWHLWEFYLKMNSASGAADGVSRFYQDGVLINNVTDAVWASGVDPATRKWNYVWLGGNSANNFSPGHEQWYAIDDVVVYTPMQSGDPRCNGQCGTDGRLPLTYAIGGGSTTPPVTPPADTTAPTVAISSPANNATVNGTTTVSATAADTVGVSKVDFYVNGALKATDTTAPFTFSWNTTSVTDGTYTLTAKAADAAGNVGVSTSVSVSVKNAAGTIPSPTAGGAIPHTLWKLKYVDSQELVGEKSPATSAFDGSTGTFWHTQWSGANPAAPHEIQIDLGQNTNLTAFRYLPRQDGSQNGMIGKYEFYVSADGATWGTPVATGTFAATTAEKQVTFPAATGRFIRLRALSEVNGKPWTSAAEINVVGTASASPVLIPHTSWKLKYADSQELVGDPGMASNAFDNSTATIWHTQWYTANPACPHEIQIDLGKSYNLSTFRYLPRQDGSQNGMIGQYEFYVSDDGITWGTSVATGTFTNSTAEKQVSFTTKTGRYIRLRALSEVNGKPWTSAADINVLGY